MPSTKVSKKADKEVKNGKAKGKARVEVEKPGKKAVREQAVEEPEDEDEDESEGGESEGEDSGVDEEGMERLMKILGDDGLNDFDRAQLGSLGGDEDEDEDEDEDDGESDGESEEGQDVSGGEESEEGEEGAAVGEDLNGDEEDEEDQDEEEPEDIALEDAESVDEDAVPRQKIEINNTVALERIRDTIKLDPSMPWTETLAVSYPETIEVDVNDDLKCELAFYKQALHSANAARTLAAKHALPFTRPADYFAEMVKTDAHMERIRQRLLDENAEIKRSEEKKREREGKKFGKQVQMEKLKERERSKKEMEERLKSLKRKRKGALDNAEADGNDAFDVAVEDAISDRPSKRGKADGGRKLPRQARDKKYGFGGPGRRGKQNTKDSTDTFSSGPKRGGPGGGRGGGRGGRGGSGGGRGRGGKPQRPGKGRRMAARS